MLLLVRKWTLTGLLEKPLKPTSLPQSSIRCFYQNRVFLPRQMHTMDRNMPVMRWAAATCPLIRPQKKARPIPRLAPLLTAER